MFSRIPQNSSNSVYYEVLPYLSERAGKSLASVNNLQVLSDASAAVLHNPSQGAQEVEHSKVLE